MQYSTLLQKCVLFFCGEAICCLDVTHVRYTFDFGLADKTGNLFRELNKDLRAMCGDDNDDVRRNLIAAWGPYMKTMLTAMYKMEPLPPAMFYRGRPEDFCEVRSIYNAGREVTWAGFTSVSRDIDQASYLAGWQMDACWSCIFTVPTTSASLASFRESKKQSSRRARR